MEDDNRGLVLSVSSSGLMLTQGLGFALAGAAAELLPITAVIGGGGAVGILVLVVLTRSLARTSRAGSDHPEG